MTVAPEIAEELYSQRQLRASEVIKSAIADIFSKGKHLNEFLFDVSITVSYVKISPDLKNATILVLPFGGSEDKDMFIKNLDLCKNKIRHELAKKAALKVLPNLKFEYDDSFDYMDKLTSLVKDLD